MDAGWRGGEDQEFAGHESQEVALATEVENVPACQSHFQRNSCPPVKTPIRPAKTRPIESRLPVFEASYRITPTRRRGVLSNHAYHESRLPVCGAGTRANAGGRRECDVTGMGLKGAFRNGLLAITTIGEPTRRLRHHSVKSGTSTCVNTYLRMCESQASGPSRLPRPRISPGRAGPRAGS